MGRAKSIPPRRRTIPVILVGLALFLSTLAVYSPAGGGQFLGWDDNFYVTANPDVQAGLTPRSIGRAFTTTTAGNWHPLTMLSLQLDRELFGGGPAGYHWTNLFLHAASACLLLLVLWRMTRCLWRSAWVAALFALHPLHVESVAWVAERKDVLSALFWMLTLLAYVWYTEAPSWRRYVCVAGSLALGLLAKPMLVTLPCVLLLLDYWPLRRLALPGTGTAGVLAGRNAGGTAPSPERRPFSLRQLLVEKIPLFALSVVFCVMAPIAQWQGQALRTLEERPFLLRLENAAVAPVVYLCKAVWPVDLAPFYPFPEHGLPAWQVGCAALVLLGVTALAWRERARRPYLAVGWLWYLGTLVPVLGLVQVGDQAWADRYTYLPLIGVLIALAWGVPEALTTWGVPRPAVGFLGVVTIALCLSLTRIQVGYWHDDHRLWQHALDVTTGNDFAENNLGVSLVQQGKLDEAMGHFARAVELNPRNDRAQVNLAQGLAWQGKQTEAVERLRAALQIHPENESAHVLLGRLYLRDRPEETLNHFREALRLRPENTATRLDLGQLFWAEGRFEEAAQQFAEVAQRDPNSAAGHFALGTALGRLGRWPEAVESLRRAVELQPRETPFRHTLGLALYEAGQTGEALDQYRAASALQPEWPAGLNAFARRVLTGKDADPRRGAEALDAAKQICQATHFRHAPYLNTLAAAYAETGQFEQAVQTARKALDLALASNQGSLAEQLRRNLQAFERHQTLREAEGNLHG
jgi:tetratricopeptide (TPR) repeat protein